MGLTKMFLTSDPDKRVSAALDMIFPKEWLAERAETDPFAEMNGNTKRNEQGKTNYQVQREVRSIISPFEVTFIHIRDLSNLCSGFP